MHLFVAVELFEFSASEFALLAREELVIVVDGLVVFEVFGVLGGEGALVAAVCLAVAGDGDGRCGSQARGRASATGDTGTLCGTLCLAALVVALQEAYVREDGVAETTRVPVDCKNRL